MDNSNSSSDDDSDVDLPSAIECDRRCKEFAGITCTDTALAMFYLQERDWSVEVSISFVVSCSLTFFKLYISVRKWANCYFYVSK